jgi:hypothetical protein
MGRRLFCKENERSLWHQGFGSWLRMKTSSRQSCFPPIGRLQQSTYVIEPMEIPLSSFDGWIKQISPAQLNELGLATLSEAFPRFLGSDPDLEERRRLEERAKHVDVVYRRKGPARRFEGDESLPRGRYYSVCEDRDGHDSGTLCLELSAYASDTCLVAVCDLLDSKRHPLFESLPSRPAIAIAFLSRPATRLLREVFGECRQGVPTVFIPYIVTEVSLERVLDLRSLSVQQWFFGSFRHGDLVFTKQAPNDVDSFLGMLPSLMFPDLGGSEFCRGGGHWLRHYGVAGLLYPSARSDAGVTYNDRILVRFKGWNLVVYRDAPASGFESAPFEPNQCHFNQVVDYSPWQNGWGPNVQIASATDRGK